MSAKDHDSSLQGEPLERLLDYLKQEHGFDFTGYKRATLSRRIGKRQQAVGAAHLDDYLTKLRDDPDEYVRLCNTVLINVTEFFRDDVPWEFLEREIIPQLFTRRPGQIRVWSAGCAAGQEAYSLAMAIADATGPDAFRERVKIYATDVDEEALATARAGGYTEKEVERVPPQRLARYFDQVDRRYVFRKEFRRSIIFGRNDLVQDAPISRIDLLVCRNTLMYFDPEAQARILSRFHFALRDGGFLFLGRAETLMSHSRMFVPVDLKRRIFTKVVDPSLEDRLLLASRRAGDDINQPSPGAARLLAAAFQSAASAQIVVDRHNELVFANDRARSLFRLTPSDLGRALQDLELSYRPLELRSALEQAYTERRAITRTDVEWRTDGESRWYEVCVAPLEMFGDIGGAGITFVDATLPKRLQMQLLQSNMELETAYEELQSTNEELETTNEELQSTVVELETTNEELQETNEELETMNEELQATNEELHTMNDELRRRSDELNEVNRFLETIFGSVRAGVVVVDRDLTVLVWNKGAEELWGLRSLEVEGKPLLDLDMGLPIDSLTQPLRGTVNGQPNAFEAVVPATNRRGRPIECRIIGNALVSTGDRGAPRGAILIMTAEERSTAQAPDARAAARTEPTPTPTGEVNG